MNNSEEDNVINLNNYTRKKESFIYSEEIDINEIVGNVIKEQEGNIDELIKNIVIKKIKK